QGFRPMTRSIASGPAFWGLLLHLSTPPPSRRPARRRRSRFSARSLSVRPRFEALEAYLLLSASIVGTVRNDQGGNGVPSTRAPGVAGESVFLDLNHDHQDRDVTTVAAASTAIGPATGGLGGIAGYYMSALNVVGLQPEITDLKVTMDLVNNGTNPVTVAVISP